MSKLDELLKQDGSRLSSQAVWDFSSGRWQCLLTAWAMPMHKHAQAAAVGRTRAEAYAAAEVELLAIIQDGRSSPPHAEALSQELDAERRTEIRRGIHNRFTVTGTPRQQALRRA